MKIPFNVYDFFAYLAAGLVVGVAMDVSVGDSWALRPELPPSAYALLLAGAYVLGHTVAHISALLLETGLVKRVLEPPYTRLMTSTKGRFWHLVFPGYHAPLPPALIAKIRDKAGAPGATLEGEALFLHAFAKVTQDAQQRDRLDSFRNLYGFARNMCVACAVAAALLWWGVGPSANIPDWLPSAALVAAVVMLYRYLKFFRLYTHQLLVVYSEWSQPTA